MTTVQTPVEGPVRTPTGSTKKTAHLVGWLFVITYVTSIAAKFVFYPPLFDTDYITGSGEDGRVTWGALSEMILIIANIGTAVALFSLLRRVHENLALAFVTARVMESVFIAVGILSVLTIVTLRQDDLGAADTASLTVVGDALTALQEWTFALGPGFVVGVGNGIILGYLMYRSRLVPRGMAMLGLVGGPLICLSGAAVMLGLIEAGSTWHNLAVVPEFFWELSLGIYLIVKGFRPTRYTEVDA
ncbi:MAG TPA: DUF4386 domain-containing protein [Nocardioides sp.]|uniref:DUF4386 domain-containing protein n=1 Tax=Nocardioides sp. TaxID=35761 RepID=UPI002B9D93AD|nr:DUF4386 domain-containing protein [Nocardioides sp.]HQR27488.1 DUF4386 domain-containing protein [Nocardioides sp.]